MKRVVFFAILVSSLPSYAACFDGEYYTTDCGEAAQAYRDRGERPPSDVVNEARAQAARKQGRAAAIEALKDVQSDLAIDSDLIDDFTKDDATNDRRREIRRQIDETLDRKITDLQFGF
jgi:hypothetical protein